MQIAHRLAVDVGTLLCAKTASPSRIGPCLFQVLIEYIFEYSLHVAICLVDELLIGLHTPVDMSSMSAASREEQASNSTGSKSLHRA